MNPQQLLFGINQGGVVDDIRIEHAKRIMRRWTWPVMRSADWPWVRPTRKCTISLDETVPYLPQNKPTYLMGVGTPENILESVDRGVDFFDCVLPARNARHGHVYTSKGKMNLLNENASGHVRSGPSMRPATVPPAAAIPAPISDICWWQEKCWACACASCTI